MDAGEPQPSATPASLKLLSATAQGELCPEGSYSAAISSDQLAMTMTFSALELHTAPAEEREASCQVHLTLEVPRGYAFSGLDVASSGYLLTSPQGAVNFDVSYSFAGNTQTQSFSHPRLSGDMAYVFHDFADQVWSPTCPPGPGQSVDVDVTLTIAAHGDASFNISAFDVEVTHQPGVVLRPCGP